MEVVDSHVEMEDAEDLELTTGFDTLEAEVIRECHLDLQLWDENVDTL